MAAIRAEVNKRVMVLKGVFEARQQTIMDVMDHEFEEKHCP